MEMEKDSIYLIECHYSDYDSSPWPIGYVKTEELAIKTVDHLNDVHKKADEILSLVWIFTSLPASYYEEIPKYPKWRSGIPESEITQEMRDEREKIKELQKEVQSRNNIRGRERSNHIDKLRQEYIDSLNLDPEVLETMKREVNNSITHYEYKLLEEL